VRTNVLFISIIIIIIIIYGLFFTKWKGDQMKNYEMGWVCSKRTGRENILVRNPEGKTPLGRST
jgi:hypothetical protein